MKLLLLDQFSDPGGAQQGLLELLPAVKARGWSALVGLPGHGESFQRIHDLGFPTARIHCGPYRSGPKSPADVARFLAGTPWLAAQIRRLAARFAADLVYVNGPRLLPAAGLAGLPQPLVFHSHSYLQPCPTVRLAGAALRRRHAWLIGSCRFVARPWQPFIQPERCRIVYNGVAGPPALEPRRAGGPPVIACIGRIAPEKGQREFVAAASLIRRSIPNARFVIYGAALFAEAGASRYDADVRAAGARESIEFPGWISDVHRALAGVDLLLVPSAAHEATTRVILEAYAAGVPVIAFRSGGIPEVVDAGGGWLADSTQDMARLAVDLLARDAASRAAVRCQARQSWVRRFTIERYHRELLDAIEQIATSPRSQDQVPH